MKNGPVTVFISSEGNITGNDVTYDVIINFNRVHHNPPRNNHVKFRQDRIRFSQVMLLKLGSELADRTESRVRDMDFTCIEVFFNATFL